MAFWVLVDPEECNLNVYPSKHNNLTLWVLWVDCLTDPVSDNENGKPVLTLSLKF